MSSWTKQNWHDAIEKHRTILIGIIAHLYGILDLSADNPTHKLSTSMRRHILRILLPAESAARRLIFILARDIKTVITPRTAPNFPRFAPNAQTVKAPSFRLYDHAKTFEHLTRHKASTATPRISFFDSASTTSAVQDSIGDTVNGALIVKRLIALKGALENLPHQAKRMAKQMERKQIAVRASKSVGLMRPIRPGFPPGHRKRRNYPVDDVLHDTDWLVKSLLNAPP